jgi:hypothetical protein
MRRVKAFLLILGLYAARGALAQNGGQVPEPAVSYVLRLERRAGHLESVCVLLNTNGRYHLERHQPRKVRVFEGGVDSGELRNIIHLVSEDPLYHAEQKDVPDLMMKADDDWVTLAVQRSGFWQKLSFPDSVSREPFQDAMVPLLTWLESINKRRLHEISEEAGRNNCLPPSKTELSQRSSIPPTSAEINLPTHDAPAVDDPPPQSIYTLQMFETRRINYQPEVTCLLVSASGDYHVVKQTRVSKKGAASWGNSFLDGTLTPAQLSSLHAVLNAPELVNQPEEEPEGELIMASNSSYSRLKIPRNGKTQKIEAWKSYRIVDQVLSSSVEDHGTIALAPLQEWLKVNIDENRAIPRSIPPNPRCKPGQ